MKIEGINQQNLPIQQNDSSASATQSPADKSDVGLWEACQGFEALFMGYLVMDRTQPQAVHQAMEHRSREEKRMLAHHRDLPSDPEQDRGRANHILPPEQ